MISLYALLITSYDRRTGIYDRPTRVIFQYVDLWRKYTNANNKQEAKLSLG